MSAVLLRWVELCAITVRPEITTPRQHNRLGLGLGVGSGLGQGLERGLGLGPRQAKLGGSRG